MIPLNEAILVALITASASIVGNIIVGRRSAKEMEHKLEVQQAVTNTKIDELTREVREHNNFARRMPVVEEQIKDLNKTTEQLRNYHMQ